MSTLYFEDLKLGAQYTTPEQAVTAEEIIAFARQFDPQSFHTDPVAAKSSLFGRLVASGWHTTAITMGLMVRGNMGLDGGVIGNGVDELRWPRPVLPGDRLRVVMTIAELNPEPSRTGRGKVKLRCQTFNQEGNVVQEMTARILVMRRPA
jgi:acyl dehydratase